MVVIAERWPSWMFALHSAGAKDIAVYVGHPSPSLRGILAQCGLDFRSLFTWASTFRAVQKARYVWIQGSKEFLHQISQELDKARRCGVIIEVVDTSLKGKVTSSDLNLEGATILSHQQVGGITSGRWVVRMDPTLQPYKLTDRLPLKRALEDILCPTVSGQVYQPPPDRRLWGRNIKKTFPGQLLPPHDHLVTVVAPGTFSPTGWVSRKLAFPELMDAYDVPLSLHSVISEVHASSLMSNQTPLFTLAAPTKILHRVITSLCGSQDDNESNTTSPVVSVREDLGPGASMLLRPGHLPDDDSESYEEGAKGYLPLPTDAHPDVKAVKHDDAKVNVALWNTVMGKMYSR